MVSIFRRPVEAIHQTVKRALDVHQPILPPQSPQIVEQILRKRKQIAHGQILVGEFAECLDIPGRKMQEKNVFGVGDSMECT